MALCSFCFIFSRTQSTLHESVHQKIQTPMRRCSDVLFFPECFLLRPNPDPEVPDFSHGHQQIFCSSFVSKPLFMSDINVDNVLTISFQGDLDKTENNTAPEASSSFISISNSAVMWETSLVGDLRPRRRFFDESHLRLTKVTWQSSVQGNWPPSRCKKNKSKERGGDDEP